MTASNSRRRVPRLHLVTDDRVLARPEFLASATAALEAGGRDLALHLRAPRTSGRRLFEMAMRLRAVSRSAGATLVINDRVDVALAVDADGVQIPGRGLPLAAARAMLGPDRVVGASIHRRDEAGAAVDAGADYLLAGTLFPSASHPGGPTSGLGWLAEIRRLGAPVIGIGGITCDLVADVLGAGAHGIAVLGAVWASSDQGRAVELLRRSIHETAE